MAHALLGPSSAKRWMTCPPSARLGESEPEKTSTYAEEGTEAHELGELILSGQSVKDFKASAKYYCGEMQEAVEVYVDFVTDAFNEAKSKDKNAILMLEQELDFSTYVPEGFGTGDAVIVYDDTIHVIDYKHGKGVPVSVKGNPQLRLYGLGAYLSFSMLYDIDHVIMSVVQPRISNIDSDQMTSEALVEWAKNDVKPRADLAFKGEGEFCAGEHCRFCPVANTCRARAQENMELAKLDFKDPPLLDDAEVAEVLSRVDELVKWAKSVKDFAQEQAEKHDKKWPGWKLVEGTSRRKYTDEEAIADVLKSKRFRVSDIYKPQTLIGITDMQKLVGKAKMTELIGDFIVKPPGKPTLVPETDKRPEINSSDSARADFE